MLRGVQVSLNSLAALCASLMGDTGRDASRAIKAACYCIRYALDGDTNVENLEVLRSEVLALSPDRVLVSSPAERRQIIDMISTINCYHEVASHDEWISPLLRSAALLTHATIAEGECSSRELMLNAIKYIDKALPLASTEPSLAEENAGAPGL